MKTSARILALVLCLITLATGCFVGCSTGDETTGAQINMYLSSEVYNFDPAYAYLDSSAAKVVGLLFEGLFRLNDKGKVEKAMCDSWKYTVDEGVDKESDADNTYTMEIKLIDTAWSDGRAVQADDFVYAWKRLLEPDFDGEGAELLFDIVGAWDRKNNGLSPDDIGLYFDKKVITIKFTHDIDADDFIKRLTSIALVPLRRDVVEYYYNWSSAPTTIVTNGPFSLVTYNPGTGMELARNTYYHHNVADDEDPQPYKHINPYKIIVDYSLNSEELMQKYEEGTLFYISELPANKEIREQYKKKVSVSDTYCTHMYYFNTNVEPFNNATVRSVLSKVINRADIVNEVVYAKAATGIVPAGIKDKTKKDDFAKNNAAPISADALSVSEAKAMLNSAGIDPSSYGEFELTVRVNAESTYNESTGGLTLRPVSSSNNRIYETVDYVVAQKVVETWNALGFNFKLKCVNTEQYQESTTSLVQYRDTMVESLFGTYGDGIGVYNADNIVAERATFDVIALDYQMLDTTALSALSVFATLYSGSISDENFKAIGHITGYNSEEYNNLINEAFTAYNAGDKNLLSEKLHAAEQLLINDAPVVPIFVYQNAVLKSGKLSGVKFSDWGYAIFNNAKLANWKNYLPSEEDDK